MPVLLAPARNGLARLSAQGLVIAGSLPEPVRRSAHICARTAVIVLAIAAITAVGCYARLIEGPISLAFLVPALQQQLNTQLADYRFRIGGALLRLSGPFDLQFRLADVSLLDDDGQELAKAPLAAVDISELALLHLALAPTEINLIGPKLLVFNAPDGSVAFTPSPAEPAAKEPPPKAAPGAPVSSAPSAAPAVRSDRAVSVQRARADINIAPLLAKMFAALKGRQGASSSLHRFGMQDATIYFSSDRGISSWHVADMHLALDESGSKSALLGDISLDQGGVPWQASFRAVDRPKERRYALTAEVRDVVPRAIWKSFSSLGSLRPLDVPLTGIAHFDLGHDGSFKGGDAELTLKKGRFFAPWDDQHPAEIDGGIVRIGYDKSKSAIKIDSIELRWDDSLLSISGRLTRQDGAHPGEPKWAVDLDGSGSKIGVAEFAIPPRGFDVFHLSGQYREDTGDFVLSKFLIASGPARIEFSGEASHVLAGGDVALSGTVSPMPLAFLKVIWPAFVAHGAREWIGVRVPKGMIEGGTFSVHLSRDLIAGLREGGDVPADAVAMQLKLSGLEIHYIKDMPPIETDSGVARLAGRRFVADFANGHIDVNGHAPVVLSDGEFAVDDLRPHLPSGKIAFKGSGSALSVMALLDEPPLGYVKAAGFKPDLLDGAVAAAFSIELPLLKNVKFKQLALAGTLSATDLKSNGLPEGLAVNGGEVNFNVTRTAIDAKGEIKVNGVPVALAWQHIFDAPPERQPTLRLAGTFDAKARDALGLKVNHIIEGDLPIGLAIATQRDGPPKLSAEANLTGAGIFLTALGWYKPIGQNAMLNFDISRRPDGFLALDNFTMTGEGIDISGQLILNEHHRIAGFTFPKFSTNALTKLEITGQLTDKNVLDVVAKGPAYDGRQFFRSLFSAGKLAEDEPAPLKDEPGLDLNIAIDEVFGFYDQTVKSVVISAKRRNGKVVFLEASGKINDQAPISARIEEKPGEPRILMSEATNAGAAFRLAGFYPAVQGGQMDLRVNLDGAGRAEKVGVLYVDDFVVSGDPAVVGKIVTKAERERAQFKHGGTGANGAPGGTQNGDQPLQFDHMKIPFAVGSGQFQVRDAAINGPLLGVTMRGSISFPRNEVNLSGTYVPMYGLNAMLSDVPVLGPLLSSRPGEGVLGITFAIAGPMSRPQVQVNPASIFAPGFFRQIFEFQNQPEADTHQRKQSEQRAPARRNGSPRSFDRPSANDD